MLQISPERGPGGEGGERPGPAGALAGSCLGQALGLVIIGGAGWAVR